MKRVGMDAEMRLGEAMELYPQAFQMFRQIGMCCVNSDNENLTMRERCTKLGVECDSFLEAVNSMI